MSSRWASRSGVEDEDVDGAHSLMSAGSGSSGTIGTSWDLFWCGGLLGLEVNDGGAVLGMPLK